MMLLKHILVAALALLLGVAAAPARSLTEAESQVLAETVEAFDAAMRAEDYGSVAKSIPPRILSHLAEKADMEAEALREIVIQQMEAALAVVNLESFSMDLSSAEYRELPDGEPYVLIPTETVVDGGDAGRIRANSHTLGLLDDGGWYLLRVEDAQQLIILRQVYPDFDGIEFPGGSMEALK